MRRTALAGLVLILSGCLSDTGAPGFASGAFSGIGDSLAALAAPRGGGDTTVTEFTLAGGAVSLRAPLGYCLDGKPRQGGRFAVIASCQIVTKGETGPMVPPGILTVYVGDPDETFEVPSPTEIATGLDAPLLYSTRSRTTSYAHLGSGGDAVLNHVDPRHWRAISRIGDRPVVISLYAPPDGALASRGGTALLRELRAGMRVVTPES